MKKNFALILFFFCCMLKAVPFTDKSGEEKAGPELAFLKTPEAFLCKDIEARFEVFFPKPNFFGEEKL